ncbi:MAG: hypothetical protein RLZZ305_879 [Actinomycetota bacterium]|jgi:hypothetical protein
MRTAGTSTFTSAALALAERAAELGLAAPGFRSPPRIVGVDRTVRRGRGGTGGVVAVRISDRPLTAILGDMIEGVIVVNRLAPPEADRVRTLLWRSMLRFTIELAGSRVA